MSDFSKYHKIIDARIQDGLFDIEVEGRDERLTGSLDFLYGCTMPVVGNYVIGSGWLGVVSSDRVPFVVLPDGTREEKRDPYAWWRTNPVKPDEKLAALKGEILRCQYEALTDPKWDLYGDAAGITDIMRDSSDPAKVNKHEVVAICSPVLSEIEKITQYNDGRAHAIKTFRKVALEYSHKSRELIWDILTTRGQNKQMFGPMPISDEEDAAILNNWFPQDPANVVLRSGITQQPAESESDRIAAITRSMCK